MTTIKRREDNRIYFHAVVNLKQNLRSTYCTIEATDRRGALRGLSAVAGLLVKVLWHIWCEIVCVTETFTVVITNASIDVVFEARPGLEDRRGQALSLKILEARPCP